MRTTHDRKPDRRVSSIWIAGRLSAAVLAGSFVLGINLFPVESSLAAEPPPLTITDRSGLILIEPGRGTDGQPGRVYPYRALAAHVLHQLSPDAVANGKEKTVKLTLDARIQYITERALREAGRAAAVVVDPHSGEILAMASVPSFDPNSGELQALKEDPLEPLSNRSVKALAPGAAYLPLISMAGLRAGLRDTKFRCTGGVQYGRFYMKCWIHTRQKGGHGELTLREAFQRSCNSFFYQYGNKAGIEQIVQTGRLMKLGEKTGLPLAEWLQLPSRPGSSRRHSHWNPVRSWKFSPWRLHLGMPCANHFHRGTILLSRSARDGLNARSYAERTKTIRHGRGPWCGQH